MKVVARKTTAWMWGIGAIWLGIVAAGTFAMMDYASSPSQPGLPPATWPAGSPVARYAKLPTLVMFIHPHCPCSRASIGELASLMAHCQGRVDARVFFIKPAGMSEPWTQTDLWRDAAQIPGVTVHLDEKGTEARLFRAETSGDTALYDVDGRLIFHGGITAARGHFGDNAGLETIQALVFHEPVQTSSTPVFGCSLFGCETNTAP